MKTQKYTTIDRVFSKVLRLIPEKFFNESDIIEYTGEVLEKMSTFHLLEGDVRILKINNFEADLPDLRRIIQVVRLHSYKEKNDECEDEIIETKKEIKVTNSTCDECENSILRIISLLEQAQIRQKSDFIPLNALMNYERYTDNVLDVTPVRLSNHTFFNSIVCPEDYNIYRSCVDEYNIVGTIHKKIRTSFKEGYIAISYLRYPIDEQTGYPLVPEDENVLSAIAYYIAWKIAEFNTWSGERQYFTLSQDFERKYKKYSILAISLLKMPLTLDEEQNRLEGNKIVPDITTYYSHNSNISKFQFLTYGK